MLSYPDLSSFLSDKLDVYWPREVGDVTRPVESRRRAIHSWLWVSTSVYVDCQQPLV